MNNDSSMLELLCSDSANNSSFLRLFRPNGFAQAGKAERVVRLWSTMQGGTPEFYQKYGLTCHQAPSVHHCHVFTGLRVKGRLENIQDCVAKLKKNIWVQRTFKMHLEHQRLIIKLKKFEKSMESNALYLCKHCGLALLESKIVYSFFPRQHF